MLNNEQKNNAAILIGEAVAQGITNKFVQDAILGVSYKESALNPAAREISYAGTDNARIRNIFASTRKLSDAELTALKKDNTKFFDFVYASLGGYKYRGRGYNQITGVGNYKAAKDSTGIDVVSNPDLLSTPQVAAKAAIAYFKKGLLNGIKLGKFPVKDINGFTNQKDAYNAVYHVNAGLGKNLYDAQGNILNDRTGGYKKGEDSLAFFRNAISTTMAGASATVDVVKKNPIKTVVVVAGLTVAGILIYKALKK